MAAPLGVPDVERERKEQFASDTAVEELLSMVSAGEESVRLARVQPDRWADMLEYS